MANKRLITSAIWEDDWFGQLGFFEQALWIGLFSKCADDQGRFLDNAVLLRAAVFPYKDVDVERIDAALAEFETASVLYRYEADGKRLIQLVRWWEHQPQQWASPSKWQAPRGWIDHVRTTRDRDVIMENWRGKDKNADDHLDWQPAVQVDIHLDDQVDIQVDDQVDVHTYIPVPVPVPVPAAAAASEAAAAPKRDEAAGHLMRLVQGRGIMPDSYQSQLWLELLDITRDTKLLDAAFREAALSSNRTPTPKYLRAILERCVNEGVAPGVRAGNGARAPTAMRSPLELRQYVDDAEVVTI